MKATRVCADTSVVSRSHPVTECVGESNVTALADVASSRITPPTSILQNECCDAERFGKPEAFLHLYTTTTNNNIIHPNTVTGTVSQPTRRDFHSKDAAVNAKTESKPLPRLIIINRIHKAQTATLLQTVFTLHDRTFAACPWVCSSVRPER